MSSYKFLFYIFAFSCIALINYATKVEGIHGGRKAYKPNYRYQAAITAKHNYSRDFELLCSGVIVSSYIVLSAAHCLLDNQGNLKEVTFFIRVGSEDLHNDVGYTRIADYIYLFDYDPKTGERDVSIITTKKSFNLSPFLDWRILKIAKPYDTHRMKEGRVTGYGKHELDSELDYRLRYSFAEITDANRCRNRQGHKINTNTQICCIMKPDMLIRTKGLCNYDGGSPLVIDGFLVGLASTNKVNCDDTLVGSVYTNLTHHYFRREITSIIYGSESSLKMYLNPTHPR